MTMLGLIKEYAKNCGRIDRFESMIKIIKKVDWLVDICNSTEMNNKKVWKGCECIDSPTHCHLAELLYILQHFLNGKRKPIKKLCLVIPC